MAVAPAASADDLKNRRRSVGIKGYPLGSSDHDEYGFANKRYNLNVTLTREKTSAKQYCRSARYSTPNLLVRSTGTDSSFVDSEC